MTLLTVLIMLLCFGIGYTFGASDRKTIRSGTIYRLNKQIESLEHLADNWKTRYEDLSKIEDHVLVRSIARMVRDNKGHYTNAELAVMRKAGAMLMNQKDHQ